MIEEARPTVAAAYRRTVERNHRPIAWWRQPFRRNRRCLCGEPNPCQRRHELLAPLEDGRPQ